MILVGSFEGDSSYNLGWLVGMMKFDDTFVPGDAWCWSVSIVDISVCFVLNSWLNGKETLLDLTKVSWVV